MCNSFLIHGISPEDVGFVKSVTGGLPPALASRLTRLEKGELIVTGQMCRVPFPVVLRVKREERIVEHPTGKTEVVDRLAELRECKNDGVCRVERRSMIGFHQNLGFLS